MLHRRPVVLLLSDHQDTSLTNFFAFLLGSKSALPAVEYFCLYAAVAILFNYFLQARDNNVEQPERTSYDTTQQPDPNLVSTSLS